MNTPNNKRRRESVKKIEKVFVEQLQSKELNQISVAEICKIAGINRATFYANFADVYALADSIREQLNMELSKVYADEIQGQYHSYDYLKLFRHIYENQLFYQTYFKLGYDHPIFLLQNDRTEADFHNRFLEYHAEFFKAGISRIIRIWLKGGCQETPEEMNEILLTEYQGRMK